MGSRACWGAHSPEPSMPSRHKRCRALVLHWERGAIEACRVAALGWCESAGGRVHDVTCRLAGLLVRRRG
eukprot:2585648-Prymnesium_polylepis.1